MLLCAAGSCSFMCLLHVFALYFVRSIVSSIVSRKACELPQAFQLSSVYYQSLLELLSDEELLELSLHVSFDEDDELLLELSLHDAPPELKLSARD